MKNMKGKSSRSAFLKKRAVAREKALQWYHRTYGGNKSSKPQKVNVTKKEKKKQDHQEPSTSTTAATATSSTSSSLGAQFAFGLQFYLEQEMRSLAEAKERIESAMKLFAALVENLNEIRNEN